VVKSLAELGTEENSALVVVVELEVAEEGGAGKPWK